MISNVYFVVIPISLFSGMTGGRRHFMTYLMLVELCGVGVLISLSMVCPLGWTHICTYVLVIGAAEAALGLAVMIKLSRSTGSDRVAVSSLLGVKDLKTGEYEAL